MVECTLVMTALLASLADEGTHSAVGAKAEEVVLRLLIQLIVILLVTRGVVLLARRLGQTDVSGEILAGILLGPSLLGALAGTIDPGFMNRLFHPSTSVIFTGLAQVGLVLLLFQIGLEFEFRTHLGEDRRPIFVISATGIAVPFLLGYLSAPWFHAHLPETVKPSLFAFRLFFAVAMSITAIPVLGRIFMELGLSHTRTAALTIGSAAVDDVTGWLILGAISLIVQDKPLLSWVLPRIAGLAVYLFVVFRLLRPVLRRAVAAHLERAGSLRVTAVAWILLLLFASATITSLLGVFAIIGGFVMGVALHDDRRFVEAWKQRVAPLVQAFFLPIFFTYTGLRTDIGTIPGGFGLLMLVLVCAIAFVAKLGGCYLAARWVGESRRSALTIGVCMNTRALMELIALNIGLDLGVLTRSMFTMLVLMAIASTFMATPLIRILMRGQERLTGEAAEVEAARAAARS
ncbi:MAG TPA: cation:proton antiporter [Planctomycetota bacterium]|nr:cation:proton antiporter [Planctomycetota bacterium]